MPQMSPTWWLTLFLMFILSLIYMIMLMYFSKIYFMNSKKEFKNKSWKNIQWKW